MSRIYDLLRDSNYGGPALQSKSGRHDGHRAFGYSPLRGEGSRRPDDIQGRGWMAGLFILQKHWRLSALFGVCVFVGVAVATFLTKPLYEPAVTLEIDPPGTQAFSLERDAGEGSDDAEYLETQAKKLQSDELALAVIRKLDLDHNPDFVRTPNPSRAAAAQTHEAAVPPGSAENAALSTFLTRLDVRRDTGSRLVYVTFASHDPRTAAQVANTLVSEFIYLNFKARHDAIMETSAWLSRQLDDIRAKMDQANRALVEFQRETGITDLDTNKSTLAEQMSELDRQLASAEGDRIQLEALLAKAQNGSPESLPQTGANPVVQELTEKLDEARVELSRAQIEYGKNHPALKQLQAEVNELQKDLNLQRRRILVRLRTAYAAAQSREQLLEQERKVTSRQLNQLAPYNTLKRQAQSETELYNSLYARVKEAGIAAASNSYNVRIVDHARVLQHPSEPRTMLNLCFGLLAAVFGGVMIGFVREALDTRIRTPEDIRIATGIPAISVLPVIGEENGARAALGATFAHNPKFGRNGNHCVPKFLLERPNSAEAEALRALYTTVMHSRERSLPQVLLVVSAYAGEGKTTIASNLAIALAGRGPTCLADADLRRAGVSRTFGLERRRGLADLLAGSADLEDVIAPVPGVRDLSIVPSGTAERNPGELMAGGSIGRAVSALRERFHFVVFDSPPILPYAEGRVLSTLVDGLIVVVRYSRTTRVAITRSVEVLSEIHAAPILEVVLNGGNSVVTDAQYYRDGKRA
jgi:polysaccharide biosynthesis transport protein